MFRRFSASQVEEQPVPTFGEEHGKTATRQRARMDAQSTKLSFFSTVRNRVSKILHPLSVTICHLLAQNAPIQGHTQKIEKVLQKTTRPSWAQLVWTTVRGRPNRIAPRKVCFCCLQARPTTSYGPRPPCFPRKSVHVYLKKFLPIFTSVRRRMRSQNLLHRNTILHQTHVSSSCSATVGFFSPASTVQPRNPKNYGPRSS
jgi:hypothetical protein